MTYAIVQKSTYVTTLSASQPVNSIHYIACGPAKQQSSSTYVVYGITFPGLSYAAAIWKAWPRQYVYARVSESGGGGEEVHFLIFYKPGGNPPAWRGLTWSGDSLSGGRRPPSSAPV
jgi:hypothetical protein